MTVPALIWLDRWGRRKPLMIGAFLMMTWMFTNAGILGGLGEVVPGGINGVPEESMRVSGTAASALIACTYLFVASYAPTWGPVSWVYVHNGSVANTYYESVLMHVAMQIPSGAISIARAWQGCCIGDIRKLGFQHLLGRIRSSSFRADPI